MLSLVEPFVSDGNKSSGFLVLLKRVVLGSGDQCRSFKLNTHYNMTTCREPCARKHTSQSLIGSRFMGRRRRRCRCIFWLSYFFSRLLSPFHFGGFFWAWARVIYGYVNCSRICTYKFLHISAFQPILYVRSLFSWSLHLHMLPLLINVWSFFSAACSEIVWHISNHEN